MNGSLRVKKGRENDYLILFIKGDAICFGFNLNVMVFLQNIK